MEPQRNKRESTALPLSRGAAGIGPGVAKTIMKSGTSNTTNGPGNSTTSNNVGPDAMTWASTWEMMSRTLEAFATRITDSSERGGGKSRTTFKKPKEFKDDSDGCIDTRVEVMRLHLEQDNLWKLQHPKNGDGKAIWHNKDRSQNNVNNHCGLPRSNEKPE